MSNLSRDQFGPFVEASDQHLDSTYPVWGQGEPTEIVKGRVSAPHQARDRVKSSKPVRKYTHMHPSRLN